jgi:hypothetical protein
MRSRKELGLPVGRRMARESQKIGGANGVPGESSIRPGILAASVGLLFAFVILGCASVDTGVKGEEATTQIDIFILVTDRATTDELLGRLQGVEKLPALQAFQKPLYRGHLTGVRDGSVYSIVVGQIDPQDAMTKKMIMQNAGRFWRPRYVLTLGTAPAVAYDEPLGAVGLVTLVCGFDLDRYEKSQDSGKCHRSDAGLFTAALSIADEWEAVAKTSTGRVGCSPPRVLKLATLSGNREIGPGFVETATALSEDLHRGLLMEREGIFIAKAVQRFRQEMREPIGSLMIRGVSEVRRPGIWREATRDTAEQEKRRVQETCAAHDTADFAVDLIRNRWPVSSYTIDP